MTTIKNTNNYTSIASPVEIFGGFIEAGFGRQLPGMWSEMIFNRAFIKVPAYKSSTWDWVGLDEEYYNSAAPFWHSGYEEFDWTYIGNTKHEFTCGTETHKGTSSLVISSNEGDGTCGVKQEGIHLVSGREYEFRIFCGVSMWRSDPGLNGFGTNERTENHSPVKISIGDNETEIDASGIVQEHKWVFTAKTTGVYPITISYEWAGSLILAYTSLMPTDNIKGWRRDVVELLKEANPTVVRFPGGCFTSFYNWRSSVGPRERRAPQESFYWGGIDENDIGLREFMELAEECGFEGQICFNMMSSTPFDARCMVEYLNAPADVGYGRLRALDGHPEPFGVRYFECDNEPIRKWTAVQYAEQCVEFVREMRQVSPEAEFLLATYSYSLECLPTMLEIAGGDINYIIYRNGDPEFVKKVLPILREYNEHTGRNIKLVNTEWLPTCHSPEPFDEPEIDSCYDWDGIRHNDYNKIFSRHEISWNYALNGAHRLLDYISYGGEFALANFNNMANTWGQNILEGAKDGAWLSSMGEIFALFARNYTPAVSALAEIDDPLLFGLFTRDGEGRELLYVINHSGSQKEITIPKEFTRAIDGLAAPKRSDHVTLNDCPIKKIAPKIEDGKTILPPLSVVVFG